jgi:hypothetical protein
MAKAVQSEHKRKKELPDMTGWSEEQIAEFWETHNSLIISIRWRTWT